MKIILNLLVIFVLIHCGKPANKEPIRISIEKGIKKEGIEIWNKQIEYTFENPDLIVKMTNWLPKKWMALEKHYTKQYSIKLWKVKFKIDTGIMIRPVYVYVLKNNDVVIAHEFGHFLGLEHNDISNSIMNPGYEQTNKPLNWFYEFK